MISTVDGSGSTGKDNNIDVISSTVIGRISADNNKITQNSCVQLTELLSPFKESLSHFRKSCEGVAGSSSALDVRVVLGDEVGLDAAGPLVRTTDNDPEEIGADGEGAIERRTAPDDAADVFPVAPTVVHAPPPGATVKVLYLRSEQFGQRIISRRY
jgi:hypothetical protein